jgi:hypothetical protein
MLTERFGRVRPLPNNGNGYGGFGYGGSNLYVVCLVDCFDPPRYVVRADNFQDAYETAVECLCESIPVGELTDEQRSHLEEHGWADWYGISPAGRLISTDDDVRCDLWIGRER